MIDVVSCAIPAANYGAPAPVRNMVEQSLPVFGSRVFNSLPRSLREHEGSLMTFKSGLDAHLQSIPDKPYLPHYPVGVLSNSLMRTHGCGCLLLQHYCRLPFFSSRRYARRFVSEAATCRGRGRRATTVAPPRDRCLML